MPISKGSILKCHRTVSGWSAIVNPHTGSIFKSRPSSPSPSSPPEPNPSTSTSAKNTFKNTLLILEKAVDGLPIPGLKAAVGGLLEIIKILDKAKQNQDALQDLVTHLRHLENAIITPLLAQQHLGISSALQERIARLASDLSTLANDWQKLKTAHKFSHRFINYEDYALAVTDMNRRIKESLDTFLLDSQISGTIVAENTQRTVAQIRKHLLSKEIHALPRANAAYNSFSRNNAPICFSGTRQGVLDDFQKWFITGSTFMYVLLGIAGVGKSTIAQTIAGLIAGESKLAASFFFSRYESERSTSRTFFPSLAFQLAQQNEEFATCISEALQASPDAAQEALSQQLQKLIIEPLKHLASSTPPMLIVLDALDECEENGAEVVLRLLLTQLSTLPFIKVFITTRPEPHLKPILDQAEERDGLVLHDIEAAVVSDDIGRFLKHELSIEEVEKVFPRCGWRCEARDMDALIQSAGRLFIVASTVERFIKDKKKRNPQRQLQLLLGSSQALEAPRHSPFAALDKLYLQVLESVLPSDKFDKHDVERFQNVVGSIIILQDPLSFEQLSILLAMDVVDVKAVLELLQSILVFSDEDPRPRVYHPSFPDFITNADRCNQTRFLIDTPHHHARLAGLCLDLMGRMLKRNICDLGIPDQYMKNQDMPDLKAKVETHIPAELVYACSYWAVHLNQCLSWGKDLVEKVKRFAFEHLLFWLEVLSLTGRMEMAYHAVKHAQVFSAHHGAGPELVTMLQDAHRFIMGSQEIIRLSALHVYFSALPFSPSESMLWQRWESEASGCIRVLGDREKEWDPVLAVLGGHSDGINSVVFSPDGNRLASASEDKTVRLWDGVTGASIFKLEGHSSSVSSVVFSPDGNRVASASDDNTVRLWDAATGTSIFKLQGHSSEVNSVVFSPDGNRLASASYDKTVQLWDAATGTSLFELEGHSSWVYSVVFSPDGDRLASASSDKTVRLWDAATGTSLFKLQGHSRSVNSVVFSPDGNRLASASRDNTVRLWDAAIGTSVFKLQGHSSEVNSVIFSPDGNRLASASRDNTVRLWDVATGTSLFKLEGHSSEVNSVVFSPDGNHLASTSRDNTVRLWDAATGTSLFKLQSHSREVNSVVFSPDGNRLASASDDNTVQLLDAATGTSVFKLQGHSRSVNSVVFSPDGNRLASASDDNTVRLCDAATGTSVFKLEGHSSWVNSVIFSPDGNRLASASYDNTVRLWDAATGTSLFKLEGHSSSVNSVVFSPDGDRLASASEDKTVWLWDAATGTSVFKLEGHSSWVNSVVFSPDGNRLASASDDNTVRLWDAATGTSLFELEGHSSSVYLVVFSPDGNRLASASTDNTVRLWDAATGLSITQHQGNLDFTSNGQPYISHSNHLYQLSWLSNASTQPPIQDNVSALPYPSPSSNLSPDFLTLVHDDKTQSYSVCAPFDKHAPRPTLCWLPFGFKQAKHAWSGKVIGAGFADGRVIFLDPAALQLE